MNRLGADLVKGEGEGGFGARLSGNVWSMIAQLHRTGRWSQQSAMTSRLVDEFFEKWYVNIFVVI